MHEAVEELQFRRTENKCLKACNRLEHLLLSRRFAVLFRQIATPNYEMHRFVQLTAEVGLFPLVLEYHKDKFVGCNPDKYALGRLLFHGGKGRKGGDKIKALPIIDIEDSNGLAFYDVRTRSGESLIAFHHQLLAACVSLPAILRCDISEWLNVHGPSARQYYQQFLSLFVRHAVLFESFLQTGSDGQFTSEIVVPAICSAQERYGHRPLICRLDPPESEGAPFWLQYPSELWPMAQSSVCLEI